MARAVGLDLGSYSVKAVWLETSARGGRQVTCLKVPRGEGEPVESMKAALRELLQMQALGTDNVVVALPGSSLTLHPLSLPFNDAKRIEATLPFELEGQLPFDLAEATYDYQVAFKEAGKTQILAGALRNDELSALLGQLEPCGVDPRALVHPALAYHSLLLSMGPPPAPPPEEQPAPLAIIDLGHERVSVAVGRPGVGVEWARTFAGGGKDLTRALAAEMGVPLAEANQWKETYGAVGSNVAQGTDAERASAAFQRALQSILREIRATLKAHSAQTHSQVTEILLCGGTAQLTGLPEQLTRDLGMPVSLLELPQELEANPGGVATLAAAQAYTLALRGTLTGVRIPRFNLRRGPYAFRRDAESARDQLLQLGMLGGGLVALLLVFMIIRGSLLSSREKDVDAQLCAVTQRVLQRCEPNYDRALNLLRGKESPTADIPKKSAVSLLADLNDHIPETLDVKFSRMDVDLDRMTLRGETLGPKEVDQLEQALKSTPCFKEVQEGKVEKTRSGVGVSFGLDVQVLCPGQETGAPHDAP